MTCYMPNFLAHSLFTLVLFYSAVCFPWRLDNVLVSLQRRIRGLIFSVLLGVNIVTYFRNTQ